MTSVLIVEDDQQLRTAVVRDLAHRGFEVTSVVSVEDALTRLGAASFDVVLTDLRLGERDGIDLLTVLAEVAPATRPILMSAFATARDHQRAVQLGAVQVLCKPFTSAELLSAIDQAIECELGFRGSVHGLSLVDMLQMFHFGRRNISIAVAGATPGEIHIRDGEIIHAARGDAEGEPALRQILAMPSGSIQTGSLAPPPRATIARPFQSLILDVLRELDESSRDGDAPDDDPFKGSFASLPPPARSVRPAPPDLDDVCHTVASGVDGAVACVVIDLHAQRIAGRCFVSATSPLPDDELVSAVTGLLHSASMARLCDELMDASSAARGAEPVCREVRLSSPSHHHLAASLGRGRGALVVVTGRSVNLGMAWAQLHAAVPLLEMHLGQLR